MEQGKRASPSLPLPHLSGCRPPPPLPPPLDTALNSGNRADSRQNAVTSTVTISMGTKAEPGEPVMKRADPCRWVGRSWQVSAVDRRLDGPLLTAARGRGQSSGVGLDAARRVPSHYALTSSRSAL